MSFLYPGTRFFPPLKGPQLTLTVVPAILLPVATVAVFTRLYSRHITKQKPAPDDWLVAVGLGLGYALWADILVCVLWGGLGSHITEIGPGNFIIFGEAGAVASGILWGTAVCITQLSILFFYVRIFGVAQPWVKYCSYVITAMVCAWWFALFGSIMGECIPLDKLWNPTEPGTCIDQNNMCGGGGIAHVIIDFFILLLPLYPVWKLHTSVRRKIYVSGVFFLGIIATICSILRITCLIDLVKINETDATYSMWLAFFLEILEVCCGIIAVSVPAFPPVMARFAGVRSRISSYTKGLLGSNRLSSRFSSKPDSRGSRKSYGSNSEKSGSSASPQLPNNSEFITSPTFLGTEEYQESEKGSEKSRFSIERGSEDRIVNPGLGANSPYSWDGHAFKHDSLGDNAV